MSLDPALLWVLVPLTPLLCLGFVLRRSKPAGYGIAIAVVPMLLLGIAPPPGLYLPELWPSAHWGLDEVLGRTWLLFTALLWGVAAVYGVRVHRGQRHEHRFWLFWLLALCGNGLLIIARDGVSFYTGFTLMSLSAYGLVVHTGTPQARRAGRLYLQLALLGEMLLLAGLMMRAHAAGIADGNPLALDFAYWQSVPVGPLELGLLVLGLGIKAGFWPLHIWLPQAHPAAPAAASAVLSGAMIKAGTLGLWSMLPAGDPLLQALAPLFVAVGLMGALVSAVLGVLVAHPKATLAWSSVGQAGYLLMILAAGWWWPEARFASGIVLAVYACHHAFAKGALFLGSGIATRYRFNRWHWFLMTLPALALAGLALTGGALAKVLLKDLFHQPGLDWLVGALSLGAAFSTVQLLHFLLRVRAVQHDLEQAIPAPRPLWWATGLLAMATLWVPWVSPVWRAGIQQVLSPDTVWALSWPILLAAGLFAALINAPGEPSLAFFAKDRVKGTLWLRGSLYCHRLLLRPILRVNGRVSMRGLRQLERRWNRCRAGVPVMTATLAAMGAMLLLGWLW